MVWVMLDPPSFCLNFPGNAKGADALLSQNIGAGGTGYSVLEGSSYPVEMEKAWLVSSLKATGPVCMPCGNLHPPAGSSPVGLKIPVENMGFLGPVNFSVYGLARSLKYWSFRPNILTMFCVDKKDTAL